MVKNYYFLKNVFVEWICDRKTIIKIHNKYNKRHNADSEITQANKGPVYYQ